MKLLATLATALVLTSYAYADPSERGLEQGARNGWENDGQIHSVPDGGGSLGLLTLGVASVLLFWKLKAREA